jgi:hypothetical protein
LERSKLRLPSLLLLHGDVLDQTNGNFNSQQKVKMFYMEQNRDGKTFGHVARMEKMRNVYAISFEYPEMNNK